MLLISRILWDVLTVFIKLIVILEHRNLSQLCKLLGMPSLQEYLGLSERKDTLQSLS